MPVPLRVVFRTGLEALLGVVLGVSLGMGLVLVLVASLATAHDAYQAIRVNASLTQEIAPFGLPSFQLAPTPADALAIKQAWQNSATPGGVSHLDSAIALSTQLPVLTVRLAVAALLIVAWAWRAARLGTTAVAVLVALIGFSALSAVTGLSLTASALGGLWPYAPYFASTMALVRLASMTAFALGLGAAVALAIAAGGGWRRRRLQPRATRSPSPALPPQSVPAATPSDFTRMLELETDGIFAAVPGRPSDWPPTEGTNPGADERFVSFRAADIIGLALSGGGIRSATFNLGLLQGMARLGVLQLFDYMSTVSGGGYVGSFWSEWLARERDRPNGPSRLFPTTGAPAIPPDVARPVDRREERHLREFSGFLAPRWGFFEVETWQAVVAVTAGLLPAVCIGLSVLGMALIAWLSLNFALASPSPWAPALVAAAITGAALYAFEWSWHRFRADLGRAAADSVWQARYVVPALGAILVVAGLESRIGDVVHAWLGETWPRLVRGVPGVAPPGWGLVAAPESSGLMRWWAISGVTDATRSPQPWIVSPRLFDYGVVWLATSAFFVLVRFFYTFRRDATTPAGLPAFDRVLMRLMGLGVLWIAVAAVWHLALNLGAIVTVIGAVASSAVFAALRNWLGTTLGRSEGTSVKSRLRPYIPQVLAYAAIVLSAAIVGQMLIRWGSHDWIRWWGAAAAMAAWLVATLFVDAETFGLHAFYRDRISRAYAGACNLVGDQDASANRDTDPRKGDSRHLSELVGRPLHLVCCAANDLDSDAVATLGRGARSAVLSKYGLSLGPYFRPWGPIGPRLGTAITASAAAFNSNMGHISTQVGPAVSFLMCMLNLRLGLWLRHPAAPFAGPRRWPGLLLYREMFGLTSATGSPRADGSIPRPLNDVHLSDGGHFENLGLYELVRRHCRYIVVSDCAADPKAAFTDLGNAVRRIREDFGVDIALDVSALRPGKDGRARQHVAVGTIAYGPTDHGILLYIKPAIVGDEPTDVLQYRQRNVEFPQEGTGDQFYDEAQWESYRRLGLHAAERIFGFIDQEGFANPTADWVFAEAMHRWGPIPEGLQAQVLEMTKRFGALEAELRERPGSRLFDEIFPELAHVPAPASLRPAGAGADSAGVITASAAATADDLALLLRVTQLMEDVWTACQLDEWWSHPLNIGWINLFARWATAPRFVFWWPLLAPMFTPGFRRFVEQRFPLRDPMQPLVRWDSSMGKVDVVAPGPPGLAAEWWLYRSAQPMHPLGPQTAGYWTTTYVNTLRLDDRRGSTADIQVGVIVATHHEDAPAVLEPAHHVGWSSDDFFVPPSLWGGGIGWHLLKGLLLKLHAEGVARCFVVVAEAPPDVRHLPERHDRVMFVQQYKKMGFRERFIGDGLDERLDIDLCRRLGWRSRRDTLLVLELGPWKARDDQSRIGS